MWKYITPMRKWTMKTLRHRVDQVVDRKISDSNYRKILSLIHKMMTSNGTP